MRNPGTIHRHPLRLAAAGVLLFCILLSGCDVAQEAQPAMGATPAAKAQAAAPNSEVSTTESPSVQVDTQSALENPDLGRAIKQGMSYTELRKAMETNGWVPMIDRSCMVNMIGPDHKAFCAAHPDSQRCGYCNQLPGLVRCSADGYCLFVFEHALDRKRLEIGMQGELDNWSYNAPEVMFGVSGWRYPLNGGD